VVEGLAGEVGASYGPAAIAAAYTFAMMRGLLRTNRAFQELREDHAIELVRLDAERAKELLRHETELEKANLASATWESAFREQVAQRLAVAQNRSLDEWLATSERLAQKPPA
jgi:chorismate mutase